MPRVSFKVNDELLTEVEEEVEERTEFDNKSQFYRYCIREMLSDSEKPSK